MSSDILAKLFDSASRVKIIRLFLLNSDEVFSPKTISWRAKVASSAVRREIGILRDISLIKPASEYVLIEGPKGKSHKKKIQGWQLNLVFPLLLALKNFVLNAAPIAREDVVKKLHKAGRLKLVVLSGIFGQGDADRVDILVVGEAIRKNILEKIIHDIEAEVGKELTYAALETQDFLYRLGMYDKFIRDILDYPHETILDKLGI